MSASTLISSAKPEPAVARRSFRFTSGSIVGLIEHPGQLSGLLASLTNVGIDRATVEIVRAAGPLNDTSGFCARLADLLCCIGPERDLARRYRAELAAGAILVTVRNVPAQKRGSVPQVLKAAGGHCIHSFGRFTVRTLTP